MDVVILVPVLARPHRVRPTMASVAANTSTGHRLLFVANEDDEQELAALTEAGADVLVVPPARRSYACKINDGYRASTEPLLFSAADDLEFHPDWFECAAAYIAAGAEVAGTVDACNARTALGLHSTHTLFTRRYVDEFGTIDQPGQVLHEGYRHDYVDDEFVGTAKARGVYAHAFESVVEHLHPNVGKAEDDETYRLGREWSANGHSIFTTRKHLWQSSS